MIPGAKRGKETLLKNNVCRVIKEFFFGAEWQESLEKEPLIIMSLNYPGFPIFPCNSLSLEVW